MNEQDDLVAVFVVNGTRTSDGPGPGVRRVPRTEAQAIVGNHRGVYGTTPPKGYSDGGDPRAAAAGVVQPRREN